MRPSELPAARANPAHPQPDPTLWRHGPARPEPLSIRRTPMLWAALCFCIGSAATRLLWQPPILWLAATLLLTALTLLALSRRIDTPSVRLVPLAALWIVTGLACTGIQPAPPPQTSLRPFADGLSRNVRGHIVRVRLLPQQPPTNAPDQEGYEEPELPPTLSIDLSVDAIEDVTPDLSRMVPITGGVRATVLADPTTPAPSLHCGDTLEAPMRLRLPERYRDPGAWQYADYLLDQGIGAHASVFARKLTVAHNPAPGWSRCRLFAAQTWASTRLLAYTHSPANRAMPPALRLTSTDAGMLNAMLFGDRAGLNHTLRLGFERTGSFHLFVVSGLHVGLIAFGLFALARRLRIPLTPATLLTIALTVVYAALTGFGVPIQRALWMTTIFLLARLLDRDRNTLNALGLAVLAVLVWSPSSLFEASFQMTFLVIVAIAGIAIPLAERTVTPFARATRHLPDTWRDIAFEPRLAQFRVMLRIIGEPFGILLGRPARNLPATLLRWLLRVIELCLLSLVTELVMILPMALYFHRATVFALPANLLSLPLIGLLVPVALLTFCATLVHPVAAVAPAALTAALLHGIAAVIGHLSRARIADVRVPAPSPAIALLALAAIALCCWAARRRHAVWAVPVLLPLTAALVLWPQPPIVTPNRLEVTAIDVGQGDSLLVVSPTGQTMLLDAGGPVGGPGHTIGQTTGFDIGEEAVAPYLWSRRIRRLDILALTHEHSDHMGGMPAILRAFRPRQLWLGPDVPSPAYTALLAEATTLGIPTRHLQAGQTIPWDEVQIAVLAPEPGYTNHVAPKNDDSLVLHLQYGASSVLLEGDAEAPEERAMLDHHRVAPVTLLKVGHHGSITSSTAPFLEAAAPQAAVISVGTGNTFGHPRPEVIARFAARHSKLYRTDLLGLTTFLLDRNGRIQEARTPIQ